MIKIAVLIACHNRREKTIKCLQSLFNQLNVEKIELKVFLVDDGSTDGTRQAVNDLFPNVIIIEGNGNLFWARGMELAWKEALKTKEKFDYYLWLNDDVYLFDTAIKELLKTQRKNTEIIVGSVCDPVTKHRTYGGWKLASKFIRPFRLKIININGKPQEIDVFNGNVVLIPNTAYLKIGIIDKIFKHAYADIEYSYRARRHGIIMLLAAKYVGECPSHTLDYEAYKKLSLFKKISNLFERKVKPPGDWFRMSYKYGGLFWPVHFFIGYIKSIIKILYSHNYFDKN
tara:strand:- start:978 stop:1835 length:858 start_codon:yes stop_codon:yes gene_type:complete